MTIIALTPAQLKTVRAVLKADRSSTPDDERGGDYGDVGVYHAMLEVVGWAHGYYGGKLPRVSEPNLAALVQELHSVEEREEFGSLTTQGYNLCRAVNALTPFERIAIEDHFDGRLGPEGAALYLAALAGLQPSDFPEDADPEHWS